MEENNHDYLQDKFELKNRLFNKVFFPTLDKIAEIQSDESNAKKYTLYPDPRYQVYDIMFTAILDEVTKFYDEKESENND